MAQAFISGNPEDGDFNQYWYSAHTINQIVEDCVRIGGKIAFLSTPSVYFALPDETRASTFCFDYDKKWASDRGFVFYDFNDLNTIPKDMYGEFDLVVVDPPFIVKEVWEKYAAAVKLLVKSGKDSATGEPLGKVILTTVIENAALLKELLGATPTVFQPSIPNLVYQYNLYTNYNSPVFSKKNPEIPE